MTKLSKKFIESIPLPSNKETFYWDSEIKGFGIKVYPTGKKAYVLQYRNLNGQSKRLTLGYHGQISTDQARELAKINLGHVSFGKDPAQIKKQGKVKKDSFDDLVKHYLYEHAKEHKRPKSINEDKKLLFKYIQPFFKDSELSQVDSKSITALHRKHKDTPYQANRMLALLSKMFSLAVNWGWADKNPVIGVPRYPEEKRERWLQDEELDRLWKVLDHYNDYPPANVIKMLILTGARKGEALNATWEQFDFKRGVWIKPSHLTKQKKTEHVPLSEEVLEFLLQIKEHSQSQYLFPGRRGDEPLVDVKRFWTKIIDEANIKNLRIHDLRHTYASHLVSSGLSLSIVGRLLGHSNPNTTQRYAHLADQVLRDATNLFAGKLKKITQKNAPPDSPLKESSDH